VLSVIKVRDNNRAANIRAENIALKQGDRDTIAVILPAIGVEVIVPKELPRGGVELVRARFRGENGDTAGNASVFRVETCGLELEFGDCFDWHRIGVAGLCGAAAFCAVNKDAVLLGPTAADLRGGDAPDNAGIRLLALSRDDARREGGE